MVSLLRGPVVLAADLGAADRPFDGPAPALVAGDPLAHVRAVDADRGLYRSEGLGRPRDLDFVPFYDQHRRRSAVYFRRLDDAEWRQAEGAAAIEAAETAALEARSVDVVRLGDERSEGAHALASAISYPVSYRGRQGRDARSGGFIAFEVAVGSGPMALRLTYWGEERLRVFVVRVDGVPIATQRLGADHPGRFFDAEYALPAALTAGKARVSVRIEPESGSAAGPVFGCRVVAPAPGGSA